MDPFWNPNLYDGPIMESILRIWIDYETQTGASSTEHPLEHIKVTMCMSYAYLIVQTRKLKTQEKNLKTREAVSPPVFPSDVM